MANGDSGAAISQSTLINFCYQYDYDERGRQVQKRVPNKGWEYAVYNVMDQPVATQDSLQRAANQWIFTKYDALQRSVITGIWNNGGTAITRTALQTTLSGITTNLYEARVNTGNGYTNVAWPISNVTATLSVDYFDGYNNIPSLPATYTITSGVSKLTRNLPTAKLTAVLNTPANQLWDVMYYDDLSRGTLSYAQHYLGGTISTSNYDAISTTYNFTNAPTTTSRLHYNVTSGLLLTINNQYLYDHMGRKTKTWEQITNGTSAPTTRTLLSQTDYNEIGQPTIKHLHSTDSVNFYQSISYTYNERGWLLSSSAPLFAMQLNYNVNLLAGSSAQYNGNIANQLWGIPGSLSGSYNYRYDKINRLTSGKSGDNNYIERSITYDLNGNIQTLGRVYGGTLIDSLAYGYGSNTTNQLLNITDATTNDAGLKHGSWTYTYNGNGHLSADPSKGINLTYNILNLPQAITGTKTITYTYDATGQKLRRVSPVTGNTDYISGIEYDANALSFIQTEEGKAVVNGTGYDYQYYLGDNLGNTRVTFSTKTTSAVTVQKDDYLPFGMEINSLLPMPKNEYLYNKKELQEELQEYDYGARFYDPVIARWNVVDPLAEVSRRWSVYNYVENNPIRLTDPDGMTASFG